MWRTARKSSIFPLDLDSPNGSDRRSRCTEESNRGKPIRKPWDCQQQLSSHQYCTLYSNRFTLSSHLTSSAASCQCARVDSCFCSFLPRALSAPRCTVLYCQTNDTSLVSLCLCSLSRHGASQSHFRCCLRPVRISILPLCAHPCSQTRIALTVTATERSLHHTPHSQPITWTA